MINPYSIDTTSGTITVTGPTLGIPRPFFTMLDAKQFAEYLNAAWNNGWKQGFEVKEEFCEHSGSRIGG